VPRDYPRLARYTWARQWPGVFLVGLSMGILSLTAFVARRSMGASPMEVAALIAIWQAPWILAPALGPLLTRANPQRVWILTGVLAFTPLLFIALIDVRVEGTGGRGAAALWPLMLTMALHYAVAIAHVPHRGAMIRTNYAPHVRGRMYGMLQVVTLLGGVLGGKAAGALLDLDARWLRVLYPVAAVLGMCGFVLLARVRWRGQRRPQPLAGSTGSTRPLEALRATWREVFRIFMEDGRFRLYEIGFMVYGIAFLLGWAQLALYAEGPLRLSYGEMTNGQSIAFPIALMCGAALWSRVTDRLGVVRVTLLAFLMLGLFYLVMLTVHGHKSYVAAFALFGFTMAAVDVGWSLGPLHFAPDGKAHMYAALHFSLVGIRSLFAPFLGFWIVRQFGYPAAFATAAVLLVAAGGVIGYLVRVSSRAS